MLRSVIGASALVVLLLIGSSVVWQHTMSGVAGGDQPAATLSLSSATLSVNPGDTFTLDIMLEMEAGSHAVSAITAVLTFDSTVLTTTAISPNTAVYPQLQALESVAGEPGTAKLALGTGSESSAAIQTSATLATITFQAIGPNGSSTLVDWQQATALSVSSWDESTENVVGSAAGATVTIIAPANRMSVNEITLSSKASKRSYSLTGRVSIKAEGVAVNGAAVTAQWTDPNGSTVTQTAKTNKSGFATFKRAVTATGMYTLTVTNVTKNGYTYNASGNVITAKSHTIP